MKATEITTITGKTITVSKEQGDIIRQGILNKTPFVTISRPNGHIIRTSTIAEVKDIWTSNPNQKTLNSSNPADRREAKYAEGYEAFKRKKQELLNK
jgi:hypothetical protein